MESNQWTFAAFANAPQLYPTDSVYILLKINEDNVIEVPKAYPYSGEWGQGNMEYISLEDNYSIPKVLDMIYLSIIEHVYYGLEIELPTVELSKIWATSTTENKFSHISIGMAPYGGVAIWAHSSKKQILIKWVKGETISVNLEDYLPISSDLNIADLCNHYIENDVLVATNLKKNGLPPQDLFDNYMKQFSYRYLPLFEKWNDDDEKWQKYEEDEIQPEFEFVEESLFDGTHDKLHDGGLMKYHEAGKPKKLAVKWHIKKSEYTAYFWFDDMLICEIFDKFYGAHPDTKTDFIIRIDAENRKYELALYRQGLKEPQIIPEEAYQLLVFKNKFEDYRSDNYNQERGAWIW